MKKLLTLFIIGITILISCSDFNQHTRENVTEIAPIPNGKYKCITDSGVKTLRNWGQEYWLLSMSDSINKLYYEANLGGHYLFFRKTENDFLILDSIKHPKVDNLYYTKTNKSTTKLTPGDTLMHLYMKDSSVIGTRTHPIFEIKDSLIFKKIK